MYNVNIPRQFYISRRNQQHSVRTHKKQRPPYTYGGLWLYFVIWGGLQDVFRNPSNESKQEILTYSALLREINQAPISDQSFAPASRDTEPPAP